MRFVLFRRGLLICMAMHLLGVHVPEIFARQFPKDEIQGFIQRGVEKGLNLDEQGSLAEIRKAIDLDRENPLGYSFLAMAHLFFLETGFEERGKGKNETALIRAVDEAQVRAEKKNRPGPPERRGLFLPGRRPDGQEPLGNPPPQLFPRPPGGPGGRGTFGKGSGVGP